MQPRAPQRRPVGRPRILTLEAVAELWRVFRQSPRTPYRQAAQHLRSRHLVDRRIDPRIVWREARRLWLPPPPAGGPA